MLTIVTLRSVLESCFSKNVIFYYWITGLAKCVRYLISNTNVANGISFETHSRKGYLQLIYIILYWLIYEWVMVNLDWYYGGCRRGQVYTSELV